MTPQQKRVLAAARSYRGTCSADWLDEMGADGKGRISRLAARIEELAVLHDCVFECIGWRNKTKVYRLVSGPDIPESPVARSPSVPAVSLSGEPTLFELDRPGTGHYSDAAA